MRESIESRVKTVVARHFNLPPSKVRLDASFVGDLGGDALDMIELGDQLGFGGDRPRQVSEK